MGKLFNAIKKNYNELVKFQESQEKDYLHNTTFDRVTKGIENTGYINYFINEIQNNADYYFGSKELFTNFIEQNKEIFPGKGNEIPKASYVYSTGTIDVKGVGYEKILNSLEEKIGEAKTNELIEKYKKYSPAKPVEIHPFEEHNKKIINQLDELQISDEKINEFKDALNYASKELFIKKDPDETDKIIDSINAVRSKQAKPNIKKVAQEVGADPEKVDSFKLNWNAVAFQVDETEEKLALKPFLSQNIELEDDYKNKVLALDKLITEKGLIPDGAVGESQHKEYGFIDYFLKVDELKTSLLKYDKLVDIKEKVDALEEITLKANELKEVSQKYEDVLGFIKDNFDISKISLSANIYSGRQQNLVKGIENFSQNFPVRWSYNNAAPGVILNGFAQLKGAAKLAGVSVEEYMNNPVKYFMQGAKKMSMEEDKKFLIPRKDEQGNQVPLGKRIAHITVMDDKAYTVILEGYKRAIRGIEFLDRTSEYNENSDKNLITSSAITSLVHNFNHSANTLFNKDLKPDYASLQNLFALGEDADDLFKLSKNYMLEDGSAIDLDETYNYKISAMKNVRALNQTRRVMTILKDYMVERKAMYLERENDIDAAPLSDQVEPAHMFVAAKKFMNDYIYKNKINLLDLDKKQRAEVMGFLNDPIKAFMEKYADEPNLLKTNGEGEVLESFDEIDDKFKIEFDKMYKKTGDDFIKAFNDLNTQTKGKNSGKSIEDILDANKGGYWERKIGTTSKEYKALVDAVEAATNPESRTYGDLNAVKVYAQKYVDHKLPQGTNFEKLSENEQRRVEFCHTLIGASLQMELNQKMVDLKIKLAPDNSKFQENLKEDVDLDVENNNNIEVQVNEIVNENIKAQ